MLSIVLFDGIGGKLSNNDAVLVDSIGRRPKVVQLDRPRITECDASLMSGIGVVKWRKAMPGVGGSIPSIDVHSLHKTGRLCQCGTNQRTEKQMLARRREATVNVRQKTNRFFH
jgi:hypothetical protein